MNSKVNVILFLTFALFAISVQAADKTFTSDGVIQNGDEYGNVFIYDTPPDHTTVDMTGGLVDSMFAYNESKLNLSGGTVYTLRSTDSSNVNVFGGTVNSLQSRDTGLVNVWTGANIDVIDTINSGVITISGGTVDRAGVQDYGIIHLSGGFISRALWAKDSGIIYVYGYDLFKTASDGEYGYGFVYGRWDDSTEFNIDFGSSETYTHIVLIPEPTSFLLIGLGSIALLRKY